LPGNSAKALILFGFLLLADFACLKILYIETAAGPPVFAHQALGNAQPIDLIEIFRLSWSWHGLCRGLII